MCKLIFNLLYHRFGACWPRDLEGFGKFGCEFPFGCPTDYKSATQQIEKLRYELA